VNNPIFIVGQGNSGTTLLNDILGKHSQLFTTKETWFFVNLGNYNKIFGDITNDVAFKKFICFLAQMFSNKKGNWKEDLQVVKNSPNIEEKYRDCITWVKHELTKVNKISYIEVFSLVFEYFTKKNNKKIWVETTPAHLFYCDKIIKIFPKAKIIHIVRNPLSVVASGKERWHKRLDKHRWLFDPIIRSIAWRTSAAKAKEFENKYKKNFYTIRYEDLILSPEIELKKLCNFLNLNFESQMLDVDIVNPADPKYFNKKGFLTQNLDKWKSILTPEEKKIVVLITNKVAKHFGYENYVKEKTKLFNFVKIFIVFTYRVPQFLFYKVNSGNLSSYKDLLNFIIKRIK